MDNMDKLNGEFADVKVSGFKYWAWMIISYICNLVGVFFSIFSLTSYAGKTGLYFNLLTLVFGAFAIQTGAWAKGNGKRNKVLTVSFIWGLVDVAIACVFLYILPMFGIGVK